MGQSASYMAKLNIAESFPANTSLEPLSEDGFVWLLVGQVASIPGTINSDFPVWIKMEISKLVSLPVYDKRSNIHVQTTVDPNGKKVGIYYKKGSSGLPTEKEEAFPASHKNGILSFTAFGVLPPAGKTSLDLYVQQSTLAPQIPQVSTSDLLSEIIQRQTNPLDSRKLEDNVTIIVGKTKIKNCSKKHKKSCKKYHTKVSEI
jgi:hypothetical protein